MAFAWNENLTNNKKKRPEVDLEMRTNLDFVIDNIIPGCVTYNATVYATHNITVSSCTTTRSSNWGYCSQDKGTVNSGYDAGYDSTYLTSVNGTDYGSYGSNSTTNTVNYTLVF